MSLTKRRKFIWPLQPSQHVSEAVMEHSLDTKTKQNHLDLPANISSVGADPIPPGGSCQMVCARIFHKFPR